MTRQEEEIIELNSTVKTKLAPSNIHGIGVFTIRDVAKGERLFCKPDGPRPRKWYSVPYGSFSKFFPEVKELLLERWPSVVNGSLFLSPNEVWPILFVNHSDDPNYEVKTDSALRDIKSGEEVTEDYRLMVNHEKIYLWLKKEGT